MKKSEALKILQLQNGASDDDVKKAHRKLILENHPDKFGQDATKRSQAEEKTKLINEARDVLLSRKWDPEYSTSGTSYGAPFSYSPYGQGSSAGSKPGGSSTSGGPAGSGFGGAGFAGFPFGMGQTVWVARDENGNFHVYAEDPTGGRRATANPFQTAAESGTGAGSHGTARPQGSGFNGTGFNGTGSGGNGFGTGGFGTGFGGFGGGGRNPFSAMGFNPFAQSQPVPVEQQLEKASHDLSFDVIMVCLKAAVFAACAMFLSTPAMGIYLYVVLSIAQGVFKRLKYFGAFLVLPLALAAVVLAPMSGGGIGVIEGLALLFSLWFDFSNITTNFSTWRALRKRIKPKKGKKATAKKG